ncbi:PspC domain-containing protein [Taibaiella koreensis]|uniref:PspC domain-containing protein n=1 Tax=Taibaiella koreensis TaxID=1268548 RepID=UPI000E59C924|nr:PspC domain-containing protein [Taibaiella koreensis]
MNKIININLAGRLIPIDESAYDQLRDYLNRLKTFFSREEGGDEIVRDMEDRMGELFQDKLSKGAPCIMATDITDMIAVMGSPEQIESEAGEEEAAKSHRKEERQNTTSQTRPPLTRSRREKMIGGVCGGLAAHFNIDSTIVRMAFFLVTLAWGAGAIVYIVLWALLPEGDGNTAVVRRRLYRNPKQKVVGGVCSGIAAYANIDPIVPRIIFAAPLLGIIFFSILGSGSFFQSLFSLMVGGLPTLVVLYIILWASLPEANTVAEKLEMRGEKVDVHNLSQAIKGGETERIAPPRRSGLGQFVAVLVKIFVFMILGTVLITLAGIIIAVLAALFGLATSSVFILPFSALITESATQRSLLWICVALTLLIPFIAIIRLLVRMISGRKVATNKWLTGTFTALFIAGVFGLFWIGTSIASDFKATYRKTYPLSLNQPVNDTLIIRQSIQDENGETERDEEDNDHEGVRFRDDSTVAISNISLRIITSPDSFYHLSVQKSARGRNSRRAQELALPLEFHYRQEGNVLYLPQDFSLPKGDPFRAQKLKVELQVPAGKVFRAEDLVSSYYTDRDFVVRPGRFRYRTREYHNWDEDVFYKMGPDGVIDNPSEKEEGAQSADDTDTSDQ